MNCRKTYTEDGMETQLGVNHMGPFLLSNLLRPSLKAAGGGRILHVVNLDYRKGKIDLKDLNSDSDYDANKAFCQSQLAIMLMVNHLASEWMKDGITLNAAYPGVCATNIKRHM